MDPSVAAQIVVLIILLFLSAFFSSAETSLTTVNKLRIRSLVEDGVKGAKRISDLIENPSKMISAILIGNNIVNLYASSLTTTLVISLGGSIPTAVGTGILTLLILIFGEITPKTLATMYAEKLAFIYAPVISLLTKVLTPVIFLLNQFSGTLLRLFHIDPNAKAKAMTETELRTIVDVSHEDGVIETEERIMITNVVDFGDSMAKDVMVPRIDMSFANVNMTYDELVAAFEKDMYTRLPVYKENRDNVIGIINMKDVFFFRGAKEDFHIENFLRTPYFTYEYKKTSELLRELKKEAISLAIVLDEYGATAGLLTIEDLIEEIVGEIRDEYDTDEEDSIQKISDNVYLVLGATKLEELNETLDLDLESEDYDSIAGHVIHLLDHLPIKDETVTEKACTYKVVEMDKNRIDKIQLTINPDYIEVEEED